MIRKVPECQDMPFVCGESCPAVVLRWWPDVQFGEVKAKKQSPADEEEERPQVKHKRRVWGLAT